MKVRALISIGTTTGKQEAGDVFEVTDIEAAAWIKAGYIEAVKEDRTERAVARPAETPEPARKRPEPPKRKGRR